MGEQTESLNSKLDLFPISLSFCILHLLSQLILERFSCVVPVDLGSFCMFREKLGSELAITFLHYKILTSWRCEEGGERNGRGRFLRSFSPRRAGSKAYADGTELIKVLLQCSHLSGPIGGLRFRYKRLQMNVVLSMAVS